MELTDVYKVAPDIRLTLSWDEMRQLCEAIDGTQSEFAAKLKQELFAKLHG